MAEWDKIYQQSGRYKYYDLSKPHENLDLIINEFKRYGAKRILDVGCGLGNNLLPLLRSGFDAYGLDSAPKAIKETKEMIKGERGKTTKVINASFEKIPFKNSYFDAVLCVQALQHGREAQIKQGIAEISRILKPGGIVFVSLPGRYAHGKQRYCLVTTAKKIEERTFLPTKGEEVGIAHLIFNKRMILKYFHTFKPIKIWQDSKDYYCFLGEKKIIINSSKPK